MTLPGELSAGGKPLWSLLPMHTGAPRWTYTTQSTVPRNLGRLIVIGAIIRSSAREVLNGRVKGAPGEVKKPQSQSGVLYAERSRRASTSIHVGSATSRMVVAVAPSTMHVLPSKTVERLKSIEPISRPGRAVCHPPPNKRPFDRHVGWPRK